MHRRSGEFIATVLSLLILPSITSASAMLVERGENAFGLRGGLYRASDFVGFEGAATATLFGRFDLGLAVERTDLDAGDRRFFYRRYTAGSVEADGPVAYPNSAGGPTMTTYAPFVGTTFRLPGAWTFRVAASYERSDISGWVESNMVEDVAVWDYTAHGYALSASVGRPVGVSDAVRLIPSFGVSYRDGIAESTVNPVLTVVFPVRTYSYTDRRSEFSFDLGVDAIIGRGAHLFTVGPHVSLGDETRSARFEIGYLFATR